MRRVHENSCKGVSLEYALQRELGTGRQTQEDATGVHPRIGQKCGCGHMQRLQGQSTATHLRLAFLLASGSTAGAQPLAGGPSSGSAPPGARPARTCSAACHHHHKWGDELRGPKLRRNRATKQHVRAWRTSAFSTQTSALRGTAARSSTALRCKGRGWGARLKVEGPAAGLGARRCCVVSLDGLMLRPRLVPQLRLQLLRVNLRILHAGNAQAISP